jgi:hypothetical protein
MGRSRKVSAWRRAAAVRRSRYSRQRIEPERCGSPFLFDRVKKLGQKSAGHLGSHTGSQIFRWRIGGGAKPGAGYRNGYRPGRVHSAEGAIEYSAPQIADRDEPFCSRLREAVRGRTEALEALAVEMYARGLSNMIVRFR